VIKRNQKPFHGHFFRRLNDEIPELDRRYRFGNHAELRRRIRVVSKAAGIATIFPQGVIVRTILKFAIVTALLGLTAIGAFAQAHEFAITAGGNFPSNDQLNPGASFAVGAQYDGRFFHLPLVGLYVDVPLVVATKSTFHSPFVCIQTPCNATSLGYRSFFFTPGLKVTLGVPLIHPYFAAGTGFAHYNTNEDVAFGNSSSTKAAYSVGGGLDMKIFPYLSLRGEVRDFISGTPDLAAITASGHTHNVVPQAGLVFRF
jgi:hypothetical protein